MLWMMIIADESRFVEVKDITDRTNHHYICSKLPYQGTRSISQKRIQLLCLLPRAGTGNLKCWRLSRNVARLCVWFTNDRLLKAYYDVVGCRSAYEKTNQVSLTCRLRIGCFDCDPVRNRRPRLEFTRHAGVDRANDIYHRLDEVK
jgi:hypothetical protein